MTPLQQDLISRGYTQSHEPHWKSTKMTGVLFQKCVKDGKGKKYYIDIWYYAENRYGNTDLPESIQAEVQFQSDGVTHECMNVTLFVKDIDKIEEVFENMWITLNLGYKELFDK